MHLRQSNHARRDVRRTWKRSQPALLVCGLERAHATSVQGPSSGLNPPCEAVRQLPRGVRFWARCETGDLDYAHVVVVVGLRTNFVRELGAISERQLAGGRWGDTHSRPFSAQASASASISHTSAGQCSSKYVMRRPFFLVPRGCGTVPNRGSHPSARRRGR